MKRWRRQPPKDRLVSVVVTGPLEPYLGALTPGEPWADQVRRDGRPLAEVAPRFPGSRQREAPVSVN